jgi:hypothetical protein
MKPDRKSRTKLIGLIVILVAVWVVIGIRYVALSRYWKARTAAQAAQQHAHPAAGADHPTPSGQTAEAEPSLRLAARVTPVPPPESDPFQPAINPRTRRATSRPTAPQPEPRPLVPLLPPPPGPSPTADRNTLRVSGIIMGNPNTAVLRVGDEHYVVREGYRLNSNIVVQTIEQSSVTLRDSRGTYRLRLGQ